MCVWGGGRSYRTKCECKGEGEREKGVLCVCGGGRVEVIAPSVSVKADRRRDKRGGGM